MHKYLYEILGALENEQGKFKGFEIFVCTNYNFDIVLVPDSVFTKETIKYIEFRLKLHKSFNIKKLPATVQSDIKMPLGHWLNEWLLNSIYGDTSESKSSNN